MGWFENYVIEVDEREDWDVFTHDEVRRAMDKLTHRDSECVAHNLHGGTTFACPADVQQ
jgi:hypothetical protein